ncbi:DUF805 domain-containing protein [Rhodoplanes sp. TEM]|uniref:DUF805 domain-containing protein n=1 Tax=Rhodoplanes tepidamans TaxID=200616 RepID=A0ABT5J824_RHOTP|nr:MULTISPECIES: DUF805 domain-containing protein [Rhodoplanes]MDC7785541.1 DUF805 domain-containing protein [Rhodoplanes tepidamans]MDC7986177.1 DUF805 domain-containing protein [Rhodoplanes sp. TEM]MDQ0353289.1 uncharacterized membrane protein YhaH (DUF805 family) [Rhodoplanes tepidamans]
MTFGEAIASGFRNYVGFEGRASRSEYWYWVLFVILVSLATGIVDYMLFGPGGISPINALASLALFLPGLAVGIRRLHDIDRTGWWMLLVITVIGALVLLVFACLRGTPGPNRFGPDPLAQDEPFARAY